MKAVWILLLALGLAGIARAQETSPPATNLLDTAESWARENLDDRVLSVLSQVDRDKVRAVLEDLLHRFEADSIYDLSAMRDTALALIPLLDSFEETDAYARWLRTRLDYLTTADQMRREFDPPPPKPGAPTPPSPPVPAQRRFWSDELRGRPLPERAEGFVRRLKPIFEEERVPPELVWLAEVESTFDPTAKSPVGAAGLFQLMPATARSLGLSTTLPDERLHPEKNARAAAKYLRHLHGRFGDWPLALAAYNAGQGRVSGLLDKAGTRSFDAIAAKLPAETQMYVPKFEATLMRREGMTLADLKSPSP